nr:hypothetical protein CFP56_70005 [Quercus suber]
MKTVKPVIPSSPKLSTGTMCSIKGIPSMHTAGNSLSRTHLTAPEQYAWRCVTTGVSDRVHLIWETFRAHSHLTRENGKPHLPYMVRNGRGLAVDSS